MIDGVGIIIIKLSKIVGKVGGINLKPPCTTRGCVTWIGHVYTLAEIFGTNYSLIK